MTRHEGGERFVVELVAQPDGDAPAVIRLRHFLKAALRAWGLRCTGVRQVNATPTPPPGATSGPPVADQSTEEGRPAAGRQGDAKVSPTSCRPR
jgi:hypothetical protein